MELNKDQRSLLLFFETACVDNAGKLNAQHMNETDFNIAKAWTRDGFVVFGRLPACECGRHTHVVELSTEAWVEAHCERRARAQRMLEARKARG